MTFRIEYIDLQITLRCNAHCANCIKLCNMPDTGLDYHGSDMTWEQVERFASQAAATDCRIEHLVVTGGEPLLHPQLAQIVDFLDHRLVRTGRVLSLEVNSNLILPAPPAIANRVVNFSRPRDNPQIHDGVFVHPDDLGRPRPTFAGCRHYRKWRIVCNVDGYSVCCAADGYIRLFQLDHLLIDFFPRDYYDFPLRRMDEVCQHCPFGTGSPAKQRNLGRPVSPIYAAQFRLANGAALAPRYPTRDHRGANAAPFTDHGFTGGLTPPRSPITAHRLPITDYRLPITDHHALHLPDSDVGPPQPGS